MTTARQATHPDHHRHACHGQLGVAEGGDRDDVWPVVAYPRSMAELARWIMRDADEESLDDLFDELTADDK
jgi:hypothetical protein